MTAVRSEKQEKNNISEEKLEDQLGGQQEYYMSEKEKYNKIERDEKYTKMN